MRQALVTVIVGARRTGKTTFINENIVKKNEKKGVRNLIIVNDFQEWTDYPLIECKKNEILNFKGTARIFFTKKTFTHVMKYFFNGSLIMDDCLSYIGRTVFGDELRTLIIRSAQHCIDLFFVGHGLRAVPVEIFTYWSYCVMFYFSENIMHRQRDLDEEVFVKLVNAYNEIKKERAVNQYARRTIKIYDI